MDKDTGDGVDGRAELEVEWVERVVATSCHRISLEKRFGKLDEVDLEYSRVQVLRGQHKLF